MVIFSNQDGFFYCGFLIFMPKSNCLRVDDCLFATNQFLENSPCFLKNLALGNQERQFGWCMGEILDYWLSGTCDDGRIKMGGKGWFFGV